MISRQNLVGQTFNGIEIISFSHVKNGKSQYLIKCHCGKEKITNGCKVKIGITKSCGCLQGFRIGNKMTQLPNGEASLNAYYGSYKIRSRRKEQEFGLTKEQFIEIIKKNCYYCNSKPKKLKNHNNRNGTYTANGIDRVDSGMGYILDNCVPCCSMCNTMKMGHTYKDFINKIKEIYKNIGSN